MRRAQTATSGSSKFSNLKSPTELCFPWSPSPVPPHVRLSRRTSRPRQSCAKTRTASTSLHGSTCKRQSCSASAMHWRSVASPVQTLPAAALPSPFACLAWPVLPFASSGAAGAAETDRVPAQANGDCAEWLATELWTCDLSRPRAALSPEPHSLHQSCLGDRTESCG